MIFQQRKKDILSKGDKSSIGELDEKILGLCEKINNSNNYYTTSSCSGRIIIIKDEEKKMSGLFEFVSHDKINFDDLKKEITRLKTGDFKFKSEPPILHIACKTLEDAEKLLKRSHESGWKHSGIISLGKNIVLELISTEKIEFPLIENGKILVDDDFLKVIIKKSNKNLETGWQKIEKLEKSLN
ncbi:MAG TPA: tRNA wybutosine-synthesizing 3 family protein [Candidatus Nanoarchaeia archaeon]|nr:tRNA wybutosine-synthesizing 3 family protein [Candidatus Nanoarchaeia archaeon]